MRAPHGLGAPSHYSFIFSLPRENFRSTAAKTTKVYTYSSILVRGPKIHARSPKDFPT